MSIDINYEALAQAGLTNFEIATIKAQRNLVQSKNTREIGKARQHASEYLIQDYLEKNWKKVYRQEELVELEGVDHDHNESGFDLYEPESKLKIQVKYRGGQSIHLEQTRRTSEKNKGLASESGHVVYSSGEFDVLIAIRPSAFRNEFLPEHDMVIIPEKELLDENKPGFLVKNVGLVLERKLRKKYTDISTTLNSLIKEKEGSNEQV